MTTQGKIKGPAWDQWAPILVVTVCALVALGAMFACLDKPLLDAHSFRQTTTSLTAFHMSRSGVELTYSTPVLGKPWQIPMEFPVFQTAVVLWHAVTPMGLDQSGKVVSILFWILCLLPLWLLVSDLGFPRSAALLFVAVLLSSPLYLYWGRSFMIETTALFFSLGMVALAYHGCVGNKPPILALGLLFGCFAALVKITTWVTACGVGGLLLLVWASGHWRSRWPWLVAGSFALVLPVVPGKLWLNYADSVKVLNPFARELIVASSANQSAWNFGTMEQKLNPATWSHIWNHITEGLLPPSPVLGPFLLPIVLVAGALMSPRRIPSILVFLAGFAAGPLIFTNLYFEHSYYWCANGVWLLLALGCAISGIWEFRPQSSWPRWAALVATVAMATSGFLVWNAKYLPVLRSLPTQEELAGAWTNPVQKLVPEKRTILIIGNDWNPNSLYYAERKGIAFPTAKWIPLPGPQLDESLALLGPEDALGAVVINEKLLAQENSAFFSSFLKKLGMSEEGIRTPFGVLFQALDLKFGGLPGGNGSKKIP